MGFLTCNSVDSNISITNVGVRPSRSAQKLVKWTSGACDNDGPTRGV